jgi:hypothetical protein
MRTRDRVSSVDGVDEVLVLVQPDLTILQRNQHAFQVGVGRRREDTHLHIQTYTYINMHVIIIMRVHISEHTHIHTLRTWDIAQGTYIVNARFPL